MAWTQAARDAAIEARRRKSKAALKQSTMRLIKTGKERVEKQFTRAVFTWKEGKFHDILKQVRENEATRLQRVRRKRDSRRELNILSEKAPQPIGKIKRLSNGNWVWHGLGRSSKTKFPTRWDAQRAAEKAFGKVKFEKVYKGRK